MNETNGLVPTTAKNTAIIETASTAAAASAKAEIEAQYAIALRMPRDIEQVRVNLLASCKRPGFAAAAIYRKPMGKKKDERGNWVENFIEGLSIRAAEEAVRAMGNIRIASATVYEDDETRKKRVTVTDLEANISYNREITLSKNVERKAVQDRDTKKWGPPADRIVLSERKNSYGSVVYIVRATEDELTIKEAALTSKIIRTEGLRLVPSDIQEEARETCYETMANKDAEDPKAAMRKIVDAFAGVGVMPAQLSEYLGHGLESVQPAEMKTLRSMYAAMRDGEAKWADYMKVVDVEAEDVPPDANATAGAALKDRIATPEPAKDAPQPAETTGTPAGAPASAPVTTEPAGEPEPMNAEIRALWDTLSAKKVNSAAKAAGINISEGEDWEVASVEKRKALLSLLRAAK